MSRLIFRVWDKEEKKFVDYPVYFNLINSEVVTELWYGYQIQVEEAIQDSNYIVQQSTGLFDKNGKEIFEGDILKVEYGDLLGETRETLIIAKNPFEYSMEEAKFLDFSYIVEIIGNKFEHPHLLEED